MRWPTGIAIGLMVVVAVNLAMAWYAVSNPPDIVPSYDTEKR